MISKEEQKVVNCIKKQFPSLTLVQSLRSDILKNPKTGKNFEIDIFIPFFNVGFEYQGKPHFSNIPNMNNCPDNSRYNDLKKIELLDLRHKKFVIVELFEQDIHGNILQNIINRISNTIPLYMKKDYHRKYLNLLFIKQYFINGVDYRKFRIDVFGRKICCLVSNSKKVFINLPLGVLNRARLLD